MWADAPPAPKNIEKMKKLAANDLINIPFTSFPLKCFSQPKLIKLTHKRQCAGRTKHPPVPVLNSEDRRSFLRAHLSRGRDHPPSHPPPRHIPSRSRSVFPFSP